MGEMGEREKREKREIQEYCQLEELFTFAEETPPLHQGVEMKMAKILHGFADFVCIGGKFNKTPCNVWLVENSLRA